MKITRKENYLGKREAEIEQLALHHNEQLKRFIRKHLHDKDAVEDLAQFTYLEALKSWHQFRGQSQLKTWLFGIAFNLVRNHNRATYKQPNSLDLDQIPLQFAIDVIDVHERVHSQRLLNKCPDELAGMPNDMRCVFNLVIIDGLSYEEAALKLNVAVGTVRSRLSRARSWLKIGLKQV
ncbi:RNA polymerase sigma factor [Vibrio coralliilyticus]|uniref:RNA polymerase sigma factor n=1 Tax=Vibrio coralliilyticus TaxID=190893 RepID=A0AAP7DEV0_9VIBR|nr:sigma-70 family RNA polymerase sigma factor [Vibrio coralliilyticus]NOJ24277.1 sigma-70 family RNA polymerase sigma factor [Vibrio coralliilyticus]